MDMNVFAKLFYGLIGLSFLVYGLISVFKKRHGAGVIIGLGAILIVMSLIIF